MIADLRALNALAPAPRGRVALSVLLGATTIVFGVGLMATAGYLVSRAAEQPAILSLTTAIVAVRFFGIGRPLARYLERLASHDLAFRVLGRTRARVYERIEPLAPAGLAGYRDGDLLARFVADVDALQNLHLRGIGPALVAVVAGAASVGAAAAVLPGAAAALAVGLLVGGIVVPAVAVRLGGRAAVARAHARGNLSAQLVELLRATPELVVHGQADERLQRVRRDDAELVRIARRAALVDGVGDGLGILVAGATVTAVLAIAVGAHAAGELDRVLIALLALLALASFEAVQPLARAARDLTETVSSGRRVLDLCDREATVVDAPAPAALPAPPFVLALENVSARYSPHEPRALDGFSLRLEPGCRTALVGPSGGGKTTVVNLLLRFLDPEEGRVTLAGRDLREYRQEDVRRAIAVAGQDAHLFSTTIRDNVLLGKPEATDAELEAALRRARIAEWVTSLPAGWDTPVGELGREISGGQRSRLVLARALVVDAPVLVLDEPTAHLDAPTAQRLVEDVVAATAGKSLLLITHRHEGLDLFDDVVVLAGTRAA